MTSTVHAWPIITVTIGDNEIVAEANGDAVAYTLAEGSSTADVATEAATEVCRRLGMKACRVQGHTKSGQVYEMVVDAELGTLENRPGPEAQEHSRNSNRRSFSRRKRTRRQHSAARKVVVWGSIVFLLLSVGVSAWHSGRDRNTQPAVAVHTPPPAQLPIPAPAGWNTYATWSTPMEGNTTRAILDLAGNPVSVDGSKVTAHDPESGVEKWSRQAPFTVRQLGAFTIDGEQRIAAAAGHDLVLFGDTREPIRVEVPPNGTVVLDGGTVPRVDLPNRRTLLVAADGDLSTRVVPAASDPIEGLGDDLVAADLKAGKIWRIGSDSAALPEPATVPKPSDDADLISVVGSIDGTVVAAWKQASGVIIGFYQLGESTSATSLAVNSFVALEGSDVPVSGLQVDRANSLFLAGSVFIDVANQQAYRLPSGGRLAAGYAWITADGKQDRINRRGELEQSTDAKQAAVPDVITANGLAITRVQGSASGTLYALSRTSPVPSLTPTPSPSLKESRK